MSSNVYTKNEILQELASKGFFVDGYTLDTFLKIWKIDAIFEDENKTEFYDRNALDMVLAKLFSSNKNEEQPPSTLPLESAVNLETSEMSPEVQPALAVEENNPVVSQPVEALPNVSTYDFSVITGNNEDKLPLENSPQPAFEATSEGLENQDNFSDFEKEKPKEEIKDYSFVQDEETKDVLSGISLSNGSSLIDELSKSNTNSEIPQHLADKSDIENDDLVFKDTSPNTLIDPNTENNDAGEGDFDDLSLLSESFEAQEKFRDYIVSELHKKNYDVSAPKEAEAKVDVSEKTLNALARSMAKKIAKQVSLLCAKEAKNSLKAEEVVKANRRLELRIKELEKENKKLRLLLVESNRNLNSYKPSAFGLYKKVTPKKEK